MNTSATPFAINPLSEQEQRQLIQRGLWTEDCPITLNRLRDVQVSYFDFSGKIHHDGHIFVLDAIAKQTHRIFQTLFQQQFPIASIKPSSEFNGDDDASMAANNSSCFNCRPITNGGLWSLHAYGLAIDINPVQNPYVQIEEGHAIFPPAGIAYLNRHPLQAGMVEPIVELFKQHGLFVWGGHWQSLHDYQHFQPSRLVAKLLAAMLPEDAIHFFALTVGCEKIMHAIESDFEPWIDAYNNNPVKFLASFDRE